MNKKNKKAVYCKMCHKNKLTNYEKYFLGGVCDICSEKERYKFGCILLNNIWV